MAESGKGINRAISLLQQGKTVAIPTETVYGLAAHAFNINAVAKIFEIKNRPIFDPLIVHLCDDSQLTEICQNIPPIFQILYQAFSPGPITYVLPKREIIPDLVTSGNSTVGIRFPCHPLTRELLQKSKFPLAAPSANLFGYVSPTTAQHVNEQLGSYIEYILDGGPASVGIESTIIDLSTDDELIILRLGGITTEDIEKVVGLKNIRIEVSRSNPNAPGMLSSHYATRKKLLFGDIERHYRLTKEKKLASITFCKKVNGIPEDYQKILSPERDLVEAAAKLFSAMHELDQNDAEIILAERFPEEGLGKAINDRLLRASVH